ncbi:MAG: porphobilinogen synthase [Candidatus Glassbacteria bacterium]|nr:porphobilinogen synthase [Candidatus Glassbacteria bacterium]
MAFPLNRLRRLRENAGIRSLVRETLVSPQDFIYPLFVVRGRRVRREIASMPGNFHLSMDELVREAEASYAQGIPAVLLFGLPGKKDAEGSESFKRRGIVQQAVRALKKELPDLYVITDVCLCEYTDHGHCGVIKDGRVDNDLTLRLLARQALSHAEAGVDMVAPSDMMDGRVAALRSALDDGGYTRTALMSYAAKYSSAFYGPFREAADSAPAFGDRRTYQMDPANAREALREVALDVEEGADVVMVKPALAYLDLVRRVRERFDVPVAAYNVSGEFSMVKAAERLGWVDGKRAMMEVLTSIKRAGADIIITYHAREAAECLKEGGL